MHNLVRELRADHDSIRNCLIEIVKNARALDSGQWEALLTLLRSLRILDRILKSDHHPKEEEALDALVTGHPEFVKSANLILQEHRSSELQVKRLLSTIDSMRTQIHRRDGLTMVILDLAEQLKKFMEIEETFLHPMIERLPNTGPHDRNTFSALQTAIAEHRGKSF